MLQKKCIAFIGGGNMTHSLLKGMLQKGYSPESIIVSNRTQEKLSALVDALGVRGAGSNTDAAKTADILVLAVKPQFIKAVCEEIAETVAVNRKKPLVISLATAIPIANIATWLSTNSLGIVRSMTNSAISIGLGTTALFANASLTAEQKSISEALFNTVGSAFWVSKETDLNKLTPLLGSGPAYLYLLIEVLEQIAISEGINASLAAQITIDMMVGASALAKQSNKSVDALRKCVTTPNGVTAAALKPLLENNRFSDLVKESFQAALNRCNNIV